MLPKSPKQLVSSPRLYPMTPPSKQYLRDRIESYGRELAELLIQRPRRALDGSREFERQPLERTSYRVSLNVGRGFNFGCGAHGDALYPLAELKWYHIRAPYSLIPERAASYLNLILNGVTPRPASRS